MARQTAFKVLSEIDEREAYSHLALDSWLSGDDLNSSDRGLATRLVYGVLTWRRALENILSRHLDRPLHSLDNEVRRQLYLGTYQLVFLDRIPDHAAVDEAVNDTKEVANPGASSLVNAVLRSIADARPIEWWHSADREIKPVKYLGEKYSLPNWLANRLKQMLGMDAAERWANGFNQVPPTYLRKTRRLRRAGAIKNISPVSSVPRAFEADGSVHDIKEAIDSGKFTVQDLGSQLVTWYTGVQSGERVLDTCAGLGGKTLHLAELVGSEGKVVAVEPHEHKTQKMLEIARKIGLESHIRVINTELETFLDEHSPPPFDRILVDAPCTAVGTMRRHPEVRWRRNESDLTRTTRTQESLLNASSKLLREEGTLTYAVCSFLVEEGPKQIARFLDNHTNWSLGSPPDRDISWDSFTNADGTLALNPADHNTDYFYAATVQKKS